MSTETDRELLELAAKAAVIRVKWENVHSCYWIELGQGLEIKPWEPLKDDGDALRLAVKRRIEFYFAENDGVMVCVAGYAASDGRIRYVIEPLGDDENSATRRCIVMAAAEIGKAMK